MLNAVVHRDYKSPSDIIIKVFDDRISISNPGKLYGSLRLEDLKRNDYVSSLRNRLLAEMFYLTGDIERYGTGFVRIREYLKDYPDISLVMEEMGIFFKLELRLAYSQVTEQVLKLLYVIRNKPMSRRELQIALDLKHREHFRREYLQPALKAGIIAMANPDRPHAPNQLYMLTEKGRKLLPESL